MIKYNDHNYQMTIIVKNYCCCQLNQRSKVSTHIKGINNFNLQEINKNFIKTNVNFND